MKRITPFLALVLAGSYATYAQNEKPLINSGAVIAEAIKLHDQGKYKDALTAYKQVSRNDTNYVYALYEAALSLHADSQFVESIRFSEEGLKESGEREREPELYTQLAISLDNSGNKERSLRVFDSALVKYPAYLPLYYNKGVTLMRMDRRDEAIKLFQQAVLINPYHSSSHYRLGQLAVEAGRPVEGFLSFVTYLLMEPSGKHYSDVIGLLSAISVANTDVLKPVGERKINLPENFQEIENIVISKIALNKNYKPLLKLDDAISRQLQVICEKLVYDKEETDFWMQYYVPMFTPIIPAKNFEPFVNLIFANVNIESIQKYNKTHKKETARVVDEIVAYANAIRSTRELHFYKRNAGEFRYKLESTSFGFGKTGVDKETRTGNWVYSFLPGNVSAKGDFNAKGEKDGFWSYYYFNGGLKGTEYVRDGKAEGESKEYFSNGVLSESGQFLAGKKQGEYKTFYFMGSLKNVLQYKDDELHGLVKRYYSSGQLQEEQQYAAGKQEGLYKAYYKNGQLETEGKFTNDLPDGPCVGFYENGRKQFEGQYVKGKHQGNWKRYYPDGTIRLVENYNNGEYEGEYSAYHTNGVPEYKVVYQKGLFTGDITYFDEDSKPLSVYTYSKNKVKGARYFDKAGKEVNRSSVQSKQLTVQVLHPDGVKHITKTYDEDGTQTGVETTYFPSGEVEIATEYDQGNTHGKSTGYFPDGKKSFELHYANGVKDGFYKGYYQNGKLQAEGWFRDDAKTGNWYYYNEHGTLTSMDHYYQGQLHGYSEAYHNNGKVANEIKYHHGWLLEQRQYDSTGKLTNLVKLSNGSGPFVLKHVNGKTSLESTMKNGSFEGAKKYFHFNGTESLSQSFLHDEPHGMSKSFSPYGKLRHEGRYEFGKKQAQWKYYTKAGTLSSTDDYVDDALHGKSITYFKNGRIDTETDYKNGDRQGLRRKFDMEGNLVYQLRFKDDVPVAYTYEDAAGKLVPEIMLPHGTGKIAAFYKNGKPSARFEYRNSKLTGKDLLFYFNGNPWMESTEYYSDTEGPYVIYHPNGKVLYATTYLNGNQHGEYKEYNEAGVLVEQAYHYNGELHGDKKHFDGSGKLTSTETYYFGTLLSIR